MHPLAQLLPNILYVLGNSPKDTPPFLPSSQYHILIIEFTYYCNDHYAQEAIHMKYTKYAPLLEAIQQHGWITPTIVTITVGIWGAIHHSTITQLKDLHIPMPQIQKLMNDIESNAIKYTAQLILNTCKLNKNHSPIIQA